VEENGGILLANSKVSFHFRNLMPRRDGLRMRPVAGGAGLDG
jgi:hypothetical protein